MSKNTNLSFLTDYITADITNGRIGINTPSPAYAFDVTGIARTSTSTYLATASGNVGIGTTSPDALLTVAGANQATGAAFNTYGNVLIYSTDSFAINKGGALSLGGKYNSAGTPIATFARIHGKKENATVDSTSGYLSFETVPEATATLTERMRITSTGNVAIGTNAPLDTYTGRTVLTINNNGAYGAFLNFGYNGSLYAAMESNTTELRISNYQNIPTIFYTNTAERMRITSGGNVGIGTSTDYGYKLALKTGSTSDSGGLMYFLNSADAVSHYFFSATNTTMNTADAGLWMRRNASTGRSINASGTINASGADYAEYMVKETTDDIAKGDIVGVNSNGKLTNIFADSVSFVIKSTDPSYVGGDTWFNVEPPLEKDFKSKNEFEIAYEEFKVKREEARAKVDRIAFSGQIPCNVLGANVGDYIIPINDNGKIKGQAISNPTFEQYQNSIAKVWKIMEDGRAWVAVKIG